MPDVKPLVVPESEDNDIMRLIVEKINEMITELNKL